MTHEEKQQKLREWLPEIAKACGLEEAKWRNEDEDYAEGCYCWAGDGEVMFHPEHDDHDSAYMRRVMELNTEWVTLQDPTGYVVQVSFWMNPLCRVSVNEPHDGSPDSMGAAERWAAIQAAAKKLGLE